MSGGSKSGVYILGETPCTRQQSNILAHFTARELRTWRRACGFCSFGYLSPTQKCFCSSLLFMCRAVRLYGQGSPVAHFPGPCTPPVHLLAHSTPHQLEHRTQGAVYLHPRNSYSCRKLNSGGGGSAGADDLADVRMRVCH